MSKLKRLNSKFLLVRKLAGYYANCLLDSADPYILNNWIVYCRENAKTIWSYTMLFLIGCFLVKRNRIFINNTIINVKNKFKIICLNIIVWFFKLSLSPFQQLKILNIFFTCILRKYFQDKQTIQFTSIFLVGQLTISS